MLSELSPEKVALAVAAGDYKAITRAQGVGPKLAQRIVLEMKDRWDLAPRPAPFRPPGASYPLPARRRKLCPP